MNEPARPLLTEADAPVVASLFAAWAQREGILARITEDEAADLAKAFITGYAYGKGSR